jgi:hypothetical protein
MGKRSLEIRRVRLEKIYKDYETEKDQSKKDKLFTEFETEEDKVEEMESKYEDRDFSKTLNTDVKDLVKTKLNTTKLSESMKILQIF